MIERFQSVNRADLVNAVQALRCGRVPVFATDMIPAFRSEALQGMANVSPESLDVIARSLTEEDIPTLERAIRAIDEGDLAWLGFKVVFDAQAAISNVDNEVTKKYGDVGSADELPLLFFCNDAKEVVASRPYSARDLFQMKDVTRGPSMHNSQFDGLLWLSVPLHESVTVWLLGASDTAAELAPLAKHVGFDVKVVDYDPSYLNEDRFPGVTRYLLDGGNFDQLAQMKASSSDYVCVLTRGHMFDPDGCVWAIGNQAHYVGMMGCKGKNNTVHDLVLSRGLTEDDWDRIKRPIGLKFGAKTPAELAIAIVAELIDVRYVQRYSEEARIRHEEGLGR